MAKYVAGCVVSHAIAFVMAASIVVNEIGMISALHGLTASGCALCAIHMVNDWSLRPSTIKQEALLHLVGQVAAAIIACLLLACFRFDGIWYSWAADYRSFLFVGLSALATTIYIALVVLCWKMFLRPAQSRTGVNYVYIVVDFVDDGYAPSEDEAIIDAEVISAERIASPEPIEETRA